MRRYLVNQDDLEGVPEDPKRCIAVVGAVVCEYPARTEEYCERQCSRSRGYGKSKLFCRQHASMTSVSIPDEETGESVSVEPSSIRQFPMFDEDPHEPLTPSSSGSTMPSVEILQIEAELRKAQDVLATAAVDIHRILQEIKRLHSQASGAR